MIRKVLIGAVLGLWTTFAVTAQDNQCPVLVETALNAADELCTTIGRNQACYGHVAIDAEPRPNTPSFSFEQAGDVVDVSSLQRLQLSPMDTLNGAWGVAVMRLQANLPDTLPGQNVTMLVFGNTAIENLGIPITALDATIVTGDDSSANLRVGPFDNAGIIGSLPQQTTVRVTGRSADNLWLLVSLPDDSLSGWIAADLLQLAGSIDTLNVVEPGAAQYGPMQAFYLRTGVGDPLCREAPADGILVQTPAGSEAVNLVINQVEVTFGSTIYFRAQPGSEMTISLVEGAAQVEQGTQTRPMLAGGRVRIPVDENLNPVGEPSAYEPYDLTVLAPLPVNHLERPVEIAPPVEQTEADILNQFAPYFEQVELSDYNTLFNLIIDTQATNPGSTEQAIFERFGVSLQPPASEVEDLGIIVPTSIIAPRSVEPTVPSTRPLNELIPPTETPVVTPEIRVEPLPTEETTPRDPGQDTDDTRTDNGEDDGRDTTESGNEEGRDTTQGNDAGRGTTDSSIDPGQIQINPQFDLPLQLIIPTPTLEPIR
jgi:hypothetical protein